MTSLENYRALNEKYDALVMELKVIQDLEDKKKKEIQALIQDIQRAIE